MCGQCAGQVAAAIHRIQYRGARAMIAFGGLLRFVLVGAEHVGAPAHVQQQRCHQCRKCRQGLQAVAADRFGQQREPVVVRHRAEERPRHFQCAERGQHIGIQSGRESAQRLLHRMPP